MRKYIGLIHKEAVSDYGVSFPDFPGVVTAGAGVREACELAEQALAFHVEGMIADGETVPEPTSLQKIKADTDHHELCALMVPLRND